MIARLRSSIAGAVAMVPMPRLTHTTIDRQEKSRAPPPGFIKAIEAPIQSIDFAVRSRMAREAVHLE
jgi:hypothetical protein